MTRLYELLEKQILTEEEYEELELMEDVEDMECLGQSGLYNCKYWYDVKLKNGESYNIYV